MELTYSVLVGVFLDSSKHSKTHVYSTGSGTRHDPVRVQSEEVTVQEFWLKTAEGSEEKIILCNVSVDARHGHEVAMIIVADDDGNADYVGYLNFSTNQAVRFKNPSTARMFAKGAAPCVLTMVLAFIAGGVGWFVEGFIVGLVAFAAGLVASVVVRNIHAVSIQADINKLFDEASQSATEKYVHTRSETQVAAL